MKNVLPVIHYCDNDNTWMQAEIAYKSGANGVFLISHSAEDSLLAPLAQKIKQENWQINGVPFKIGLNLLSTAALEAFDTVRDYQLDALWLDYAGVNSSGLSSLAEKLLVKMKDSPHIDVFASVAFKYQATEDFPAQAALVAKNNGFIPTTSGTKTGVAPTVEKIRSMSEATGGILAVASGMTVENVSQYAPYLSHILVSTGISSSEFEFDENALKELIKNYR